jgi:superfamily I DNA/RNA helicase
MQQKEIIFGAPGCGKTTYLINVLKEVLKSYAPERIAIVSFTKKGAYELLNRALAEFDLPEDAFPYARTLHSICFRALNMSIYDMLSKNDYRDFSKAMNMNFVGYYTEEFFHNDDRFLHLYFLKQNNYDMYIKVRDAMQENIITLKHVAHNYKRYKEHAKKHDFTDMLLNTIKKDINLDIDIAIIDEAQDLTTLQWDTCDVLFKNAKRIYIAGDDDQAIYEWTGADITRFLSIDGTKTILNKSWRLRSNLLTFAKKITSKIDVRVDKDFKPLEEGGNIHYYNTIKDFKFNPEESYYCLARNNYYLKRYTTELKRQTLIFQHKHKLSADPDIIHAINSFNAYKKGEALDKDAIKVQKYLKKDAKHIDKLSWFECFNLKPDDIFYYRKLIQNKVEITEPKITVNTIHGVKGGEADNVILFMDVTKVVYHNLYTLSDSELRCLYVACTRAKFNLHIIHAETKYSYTEIFKELNNEYNL